MSDLIVLDGVKVMSRVGVPARERARAQRLEISVTLHARLGRAARTERIADTVDYALVHRRLAQIARERPRPLIETLAGDVARALLWEFRVKRVEVEVRKFILPRTRFVAVKISKTK